MNLDLDRSTWERVRFGDVVRNVNETVKDAEVAGIDRIIALEHLDPGELQISRWGDVADGTTFTPERLVNSTDPQEFDWLDYGRDYYAAVSFNHAPDGRRLMIGWASNWDYANETPTAPWRSAMSLVREMRLVRSADDRLRLAQRPVLPKDRQDLTVFELSVPAAPGDRHAVVLSGADDERLVLTVDGAERSITCDRTASGATAFHDGFPSVDRAPLPPEAADSVDLMIVVDATIVEIYVADGLVTMTEQVFPSEPYRHLHVDALPA